MTTSEQTNKQKSLIKELDELCSFFGLNYKDILGQPKKWRTVHLELAKNQIIRLRFI